MTPHNEAKKGDIAKCVLMPGDPLRAKFIAENFLENIKVVNKVRNMFCYTGTYKGVEISVMGSGMGIPSIGIYSYELFKFYDVDTIIRVGSAGSYTDELNIFDIVLADKAYSESTYPMSQSGDDSEYQYAQGDISDYIEKAAIDNNENVKRTCVHSADAFYTEDSGINFKEVYKKHGCECVDMESVALFHNAKVLKKNATTILTISDSLVKHEETTPEEREKGFGKMMEIALEAIVLKNK